MRERFLTWLSSLRARLIITYVMVTAISFVLLYLMLLSPVEGVLMGREEKNLEEIAYTLGTTIRTPWKDAQAWQQDQFWNQRRCHDLAPVIRARIRMLDAHGKVLTDSYCTQSLDVPGCTRRWDVWTRALATYPNLSDREEVKAARIGRVAWKKRGEGHSPHVTSTLFVAKPILREFPLKSGRMHVAFIMYLEKPIPVLRREVNEDLGHLKRLFLTGALGSLFVTILVSILLSGPLSSGLRGATRVAQTLASGQMDQRMRVQGRDEVGQLGAAFNQMADALQRHEQLRRDLLADVSHELRTPLTAIAGCADTLADGALRDDPEAAERFLGIIVKESERLQRLVADILELSKLQAGVVAIPREPLPLLPLIADAVEIARLHARQEGVQILCNIPDALTTEPPTVLANEDRLMQALRNLLDNARHHSHDGDTVTLALELRETMVVIHIRDAGEGIPPESLPWVFDRFYRAGKGGKQGGTGLGLAIVRAIMLAHDGCITVESTLGQGTTFSLHLPRVQADVTDIS